MKRSVCSWCRGVLLASCLATPTLAGESVEPSKEAAVPAASSQQTSAQVPAIDDMIRLGGRFLARGVRGSWSPDGQQVAFAAVSGAGSTQTPTGIAILELRSGEIRQLTDSGEDPSWSSGHGRWIAYTKTAENQRHLWVIEAAGGQPRKLAVEAFPYWGADGQTVYFSGGDTEAVMQITVDADSPEATKVMDVPYRFPSVSPDGRRVAYRSGQWLHVVDRETGQTVK